MSKYPLEQIRSDFPMCENGIYLDTAATALKAKPVVDAISNFYLNEYATVNRSIYPASVRATEKYHGVREKVAHFINANSPDEIVFTSGTTGSINLLARSFPFHDGDEVIITDGEHHSNIVPWQLNPKITLKIAPLNQDGDLDISAFKALLSSKTRLVIMPHISNVTGSVLPVKEVTKLAHEVKALVALDGAQYAPHHPLDVSALDVDFYAFSGHKLYGPTGIGILYGKYSLLETMHPFMGGGDMIDHVTFDKTTYQKPPHRFEAGTPPIAQVIGLGKAIDYLAQIGMDAIEAHESALLEYALEKLKTVNELTIIGNPKHRSGIISFTLDGVHPLDLATMLGANGVAIRSGHLCAQPLLKKLGLESVSRLSLGMHSSFEEIDQFVNHLRATIATLFAIQ